MSEEEKEIRVVTSSSGKYRLRVTSRITKPGCWNYTAGEVFLTETGESLVKVDRNYSSFPYAWVEGHPNGHDYLICGADYQGQTVIELDTRTRKDFLPEAAAHGVGFCWVDYRYVPEAQVVVVHGCIWAAPFEVRIYDFANPMEGWPELTLPEDRCTWDSKKEPEFLPDGRIVFFETRDEDDEEDDKEEPQVISRTTYLREGTQLVFDEEWIHPEEQERRRKREEAQRKWDEEWKRYQAEDPLFLFVKENRKSYGFEGEVFFFVGQCYTGWCPDFTGTDGRVGVNLPKIGNGPSLELEWGRTIAPIKLHYYPPGQSKRVDFFFSRSLEGMKEALEKARAISGA